MAPRPSPGETPDRAEDILTEAARLFRRSGYHAVGVDDIGEAVGITGGAIYRHFDSKETLLAVMIDRVVAALAEILETTLGRDREPSLAVLAELTVRTAIEDRDLMSAYQREMRSLPPELRARVREQQRKLSRLWARALRAELPHTSAAEVRYRTSALISLALMPVTYDSTLPAEEYQALVVRLVLAVGSARLEGPVSRRSAKPPVAEPRVRRRELILQEAIVLFRKHGYAAVTMEAIGAAAGIDGSSVYRHYRDKGEILSTAYEMAGRRLLATLGDPAAQTDDHRPAVVDMVGGYIDQAMSHPDLTAVWLTESTHLTGTRGRAARQLQRTYVEQLTQALRAGRPALDEPQAQAVVRGVLLLINGVVALGMTPSFSATRLRALLVTMARACFDAPG